MYKLKPTVALFALFSYGVANAALPPPTTIDVNSGGNITSPAIAAAPPSIRDELVKSTRSMVADQVAEYQYSQLTPEEMYRIKSIELEKERIGANPYLSIPEPVVRSLAVSLNPGEQPPLVRVSKDMLTSIVFTDNDGQPWYIDKVTINRNQFSDAANMPSDETGEVTPTNILTLEPNENFVFGNVSINLKGKALPVILILASGQPTVDLRVDARIPGRNPDAAYVPGSSVVRAQTDIDNDALAFLDGSIPDLAEPLIASDVAAQGWEYNNSLYVKSRLDVLFPAYSSRASTADGVNIYRFDTTTPNNSITLMQRHGQPVTVSFEPAPYYQYNQ